MMKHKKQWVIALLSCALVGCDTSGDGSLESCATSYTGTFTGTQEGLISANLSVDGLLSFTFLGADDFTFDGRQGAVDGRAAVDEVGQIDHPRLTGDFDFDACTAEGMWTRSDETGSFSLAVPQ